MIFVFFKGSASYSLVCKQLPNVLYYGAPWDLHNSFFLKTLMRAHLCHFSNKIISLPFKSIWNRTYKRIKKRFPNDKVCFVFDAHYYWILKSKTIPYIKEKLKSHVCLYFNDKVSMYTSLYRSFPSMEVLKDNFDFVMTYNPIDSKRFGLVLTPPIIKDYSFVPENSNYSSDVFFVGKNKGRIEKLSLIYEKCVKEGLKCAFFVTDVSEEQQKIKGIKYNSPIDYSEALLFSKNTKCIVNLVQDEAQGFTLRDGEALFFKKYLLTDNSYLKSLHFFDENQIIWFDDTFFEKELKEIIQNKLSYNNDLDSYSELGFYNWFEHLFDE